VGLPQLQCSLFSNYFGQSCCYCVYVVMFMWMCQPGVSCRLRATRQRRQNRLSSCHSQWTIFLVRHHSFVLSHAAAYADIGGQNVVFKTDNMCFDCITAVKKSDFGLRQVMLTLIFPSLYSMPHVETNWTIAVCESHLTVAVLHFENLVIIIIVRYMYCTVSTVL